MIVVRVKMAFPLLKGEGRGRWMWRGGNGGCEEARRRCCGDSEGGVDSSIFLLLLLLFFREEAGSVARLGSNLPWAKRMDVIQLPQEIFHLLPCSVHLHLSYDYSRLQKRKSLTISSALFVFISVARLRVRMGNLNRTIPARGRMMTFD